MLIRNGARNVQCPKDPFSTKKVLGPLSDCILHSDGSYNTALSPNCEHGPSLARHAGFGRVCVRGSSGALRYFRVSSLRNLEVLQARKSGCAKPSHKTVVVLYMVRVRSHGSVCVWLGLFPCPCAYVSVSDALLRNLPRCFCVYVCACPFVGVIGRVVVRICSRCPTLKCHSVAQRLPSRA